MAAANTNSPMEVATRYSANVKPARRKRLAHDVRLKTIFCDVCAHAAALRTETRYPVDRDRDLKQIGLVLCAERRGRLGDRDRSSIVRQAVGLQWINADYKVRGHEAVGIDLRPVVEANGVQLLTEDLSDSFVLLASSYH